MWAYGGESCTRHDSLIIMIWCIISLVLNVSYFECVPVGVEYIERDFNVLLDTLASSLKLPPLQGQIQVIACVT